MENLNVNIRIAEAKDVIEGKISDKYLGSLDYSLLTDYIESEDDLKEIIKIDEDKRYSDDIISVRFDYSWEDKDLTKMNLKINAVKKYIRNLNSIKEKEINKLIKESKDKLKRDCYKNYLNSYKNMNKSYAKHYIKEIKENYIKSTTKLREDLYKNGFTIGDKHYVRFIRSSGSARAGKCLFINKKYYDKLMNWIFAGVEVDGKKIDLAGFESYISLVASGSVGRFKLNPENILLIDDCHSKFLNNEDTMVTRLVNGELETTRERLNISNNIFDGEALLDSSIFKSCEINKIPTDLSDKATLQIRNKFYKGQGIKCNIQKFYKDYFKDEYETAIVKDMFGNEMLAKDVRLITTPSSLKYLKYFKDKKVGYNKWREIESVEWAICKYDKPTHHFEGMTQTHYQLLNSLGLSKEKMRELLKDTINYINLLKTDDRVFKYNVNIKSEIADDFTINSKDKLIKALLTWNKDFINTKLCWDYRKEIVSSYINNVRRGHILVEGNYSIVCNNVVEMLYASVGDLIEKDGRLQIKDKSEVKLEGYEAISMKFDNVEEFAAVRSPQPSMANVGVYKNRKCPNHPYFKELEKYFNTNSKEVIFTNSINVNKMEKFSSEDFDIDSELITNNPIIVEYAKEIQHFAVNNDMTPKTPNPMLRTPENLAYTDVKTSCSRIGEVINLVQALNSVYWDSIYRGSTHEELEELYKDICQLNSLSCIEIDRCKKTSPVDTAKELKKIREKGYLDNVKPHFMKWCNEFEKGEKKPVYKKFEAGMDYLEEIISEEIIDLDDIKYIKLSSLIDLKKRKDEKRKDGEVNANKPEANRNTINKVIALINDYFKEIIEIYMNNMINNKEKDFKVYEIEQKCAKDERIVNKLKDKKVFKTIIKRCEKYEKYSKEIRKIKRSLATEIDLERVYKLNNELEKYNKRIAKVEEFKSFRRILKMLFLVNNVILLDCFENRAEEYEKKPYILYGHKKLI